MAIIRSFAAAYYNVYCNCNPVVQAWIWTAHETGAKNLLQNLGARRCCSFMLHKRFIWLTF